MFKLPSILSDKEEKKQEKDKIKFLDESLDNYFSAFPAEEDMKKLLSQSFVINMPMRGVGGDGYWLHELEGVLFIVIFDCMGHGRIASMMTRIYLSAIKKAIIENNIIEPSLILDEIHQLIKITFKDKDAVLLGSGADMAILKYERKSKKKVITYAGAKIDLVFTKNEGKIERIKGSKRQLGTFFELERQYETHEVSIDEVDKLRFYLFTDGVTDLIGGPHDKKFTFAQASNLLENIQTLSMIQQKKEVQQRLMSWMGINEPTDDLLMLGFEI